MDCLYVGLQQQQYLLYEKLLWVVCSKAQQLLSVSRQDVEPGDDVKEAASHALGLGYVAVQPVLTAQLPCARKVVCLQQSRSEYKGRMAGLRD